MKEDKANKITNINRMETVSQTLGLVSPSVKEQREPRKPRVFSIPHNFTENWIRLQQIAKLIGRKK